MYLKNLQIFSPKVYPFWINEIIPIPRADDPNYPFQIMEEYKRLMGVEFHIKFQSETFFGAQTVDTPMDISASPKEAVAQLRLINKPSAMKKKKEDGEDYLYYHRGGINFQFEHYYYRVKHDGLSAGVATEYSDVSDNNILKNSTIDVDFQLFDFFDKNENAVAAICLCPKFLVSSICFPWDVFHGENGYVFYNTNTLSDTPSPRPEDCTFEYRIKPATP
jgi:hypothetical protein